MLRNAMNKRLAIYFQKHMFKVKYMYNLHKLGKIYVNLFEKYVGNGGMFLDALIKACYLYFWKY